MKGARAISTIVVFLLLMLAPVTAVGSDGCLGHDQAAITTYQLAALQAEGQPMTRNAAETPELDAFALAWLQAEGQVMVSAVVPAADDPATAIAAYERAVLQAEGQAFVEVLMASCQA